MAKPVKTPSERVIKSGSITRPRRLPAAPQLTGKLIFFHGWCKKCKLCSVVCPHEAIEMNKDGRPVLAHPEKCKLCSLCWSICPDFAIVKNSDMDKDDDTLQDNS